MLEDTIEGQKGLPDESGLSREIKLVLKEQHLRLKALLNTHLLEFREVCERVIESGMTEDSRASLEDFTRQIESEGEAFSVALKCEFSNLFTPGAKRLDYRFHNLSYKQQLSHVKDLARTSITRAREILQTLLTSWEGIRFNEKGDSVEFTRNLQGALKATSCKLLLGDQPCTIVFQHTERSCSFKFVQGQKYVASSPSLPKLLLFQKKIKKI